MCVYWFTHIHVIIEDILWFSSRAATGDSRNWGMELLANHPPFNQNHSYLSVLYITFI